MKTFRRFNTGWRAGSGQVMAIMVLALVFAVGFPGIGQAADITVTNNTSYQLSGTVRPSFGTAWGFRNVGAGPVSRTFPMAVITQIVLTNQNSAKRGYMVCTMTFSGGGPTIAPSFSQDYPSPHSVFTWDTTVLLADPSASLSVECVDKPK